MVRRYTTGSTVIAISLLRNEMLSSLESGSGAAAMPPIQGVSLRMLARADASLRGSWWRPGLEHLRHGTFGWYIRRASRKRREQLTCCSNFGSFVALPELGTDWAEMLPRPGFRT